MARRLHPSHAPPVRASRRLRERSSPGDVRTRRTEVPVAAAAELPLGAVSVTDLFVILVENHAFQVREAVQALSLGMLAAGYPADHESVAATDALDILEAILATRG